MTTYVSPYSVLALPTPSEIGEYVANTLINDKGCFDVDAQLAEKVAEQFDEILSGLDDVPVVSASGLKSARDTLTQYTVENEDEWRPVVVLSDRATEIENGLEISSVGDVKKVIVKANTSTPVITAAGTMSKTAISDFKLTIAATATTFDTFTAKYQTGIKLGEWIEAVVGDGSNITSIQSLVSLDTPLDTVLSNTTTVKFVAGVNVDKYRFISVTFTSGTTNELTTASAPGASMDIEITFSDLIYGEKWSNPALTSQILDKLGATHATLNLNRTSDYVKLDNNVTTLEDQTGATTTALVFSDGINEISYPNANVKAKMASQLYVSFDIKNIGTNYTWSMVRQAMLDAYVKSVSGAYSEWSVDLQIPLGSSSVVNGNTAADTTVRINLFESGNVVNYVAASQLLRNVSTATAMYWRSTVAAAPGSVEIDPSCADIVTVNLAGSSARQTNADIAAAINVLLDSTQYDGVVSAVPVSDTATQIFRTSPATVEYILRSVFVTSKYLYGGEPLYYDVRREQEVMAKVMRYFAFVLFMFGSEYYQAPDLTRLLSGTQQFAPSTFKYIVRDGDHGFTASDFFEKSQTPYYNRYVSTDKCLAKPQDYIDALGQLSVLLFKNQAVDDCEYELLVSNFRELIGGSMNVPDFVSILSRDHPLTCEILLKYRAAIENDLLAIPCSACVDYCKAKLAHAGWTGLEGIISGDACNDEWYAYIREEACCGCLDASTITSILLGAFSRVISEPTLDQLEVYNKYVDIFLRGRREIIKKQVSDQRRSLDRERCRKDC